MDDRRSAVVVGGGVAGLATGLALHQAGWDVRVRERAATLERGGAGLVLWPNALRCLRALGVLDDVRRRATTLTESRVARPDGRVLSRVPMATYDEPGALGVLRADLVEVLAAALAPGVLELGAPVSAADGLGADVVVGADGIHSALRTSSWPDAQPVDRGYTVWRAVLGRDPQDGCGPTGLTETWGRGVRFGVVPVGSDATYLYAVAPAPRSGGGPDGGSHGGHDDLELVRRLFGGWAAPVPGLLDRMRPGDLLRHDVHDLRPGGVPLHTGRVVLVGDAAHAMEPNLGQGACLALEDAVVLAHHLSGAGSAAAGLAAYDAARRRRVKALARRSRQVGRLAQHAHQWGSAVREAAMRVTPDSFAARAARGAAAWEPPVSACRVSARSRPVA